MVEYCDFFEMPAAKILDFFRGLKTCSKAPQGISNEIEINRFILWEFETQELRSKFGNSYTLCMPDGTFLWKTHLFQSRSF